jgi:hypothetical protein
MFSRENSMMSRYTAKIVHLALALIVGLMVGMLSFSAHARVFRNAYVSFELPEKWECVLEQTEYVCKANDPAIDNREAIIVLTAKEVGPQDSLPVYDQYLRAPRTIPSRLGQPLQSQVLKVEQINIGSHPWVDGMHLSSEVPNYYTRYLATTKDKIGILVTFSAHKLHYTKYSSDFFRAIESLRITASKGLLGGQGGGAALPGSEIMGTNVQSALPGEELLPEEGTGSGSSGSMTQSILGLAIIIGAVGAYLLLKRRQKK